MYKLKITDISFSINNNDEITIVKYINKEQKEIIIPESFIIGNKRFKVSKIDDRAFRDKKITSVIISDGIKTIGIGAFEANKIASVSIPDSITNIGI
jgi:hypothetical protein